MTLGLNTRELPEPLWLEKDGWNFQMVSFSP